MPNQISLLPSRRGFLATSAGAGGAILVGTACRCALGEEVDQPVAKVMAGTVDIDMHNHVYPGTEPHLQGGPPPGGPPPRQGKQQGQSF